MDSSPVAINRGYGLRASLKKITANTQQHSLNLTNMRSSYLNSKKVSGGKNDSMISIAQASTIHSVNDASFESVSPKPCSAEDEIHEGFGGHETADD